MKTNPKDGSFGSRNEIRSRENVATDGMNLEDNNGRGVVQQLC